MKAADMLSALPVEVFDKQSPSIFFMSNSRLMAFTGIRKDSNSNLVLFRE